MLHVCASSPESQPYPGLHQKEHDQQVKGGDPAPLPCSRETLLGVLYTVLVSSTYEGHGTVGTSPEEGHEDDQGTGAPSV